VGGWTRFFRLGCVQYASYPGAKGKMLLDVIRRLATDPMFEVIELTRVNGARLRLEISRILDSAEIMVIFSGGPIYLSENIELGSLDRVVRGRSLDKAKRLVDEAVEMGAQGHLVASGPDPGPEARAAARSFLADSLVELCRYATANSPLPLKVTLEPFDRQVEHRALIGPTKEAVRVVLEIRKFASDFGLTLDLSHLAQLGEDPAVAVRTAVDVISHVHLASCYLGDPSDPAYGDKHVRFGLASAAVSETTVVSFLRALRTNGVFTPGKIPVSLEVRPQGDENPEIVLAAAKRSFLRAWRLVEAKEEMTQIE
jgi:sugar phosphate isomerase/epimerase